MKAPETNSVDSITVVESDGSMVSTTQGWKEAKLAMVYTFPDPVEN